MHAIYKYFIQQIASLKGNCRNMQIAWWVSRWVRSYDGSRRVRVFRYFYFTWKMGARPLLNPGASWKMFISIVFLCVDSRLLSTVGTSDKMFSVSLRIFYTFEIENIRECTRCRKWHDNNIHKYLSKRDGFESKETPLFVCVAVHFALRTKFVNVIEFERSSNARLWFDHSTRRQRADGCELWTN